MSEPITITRGGCSAALYCADCLDVLPGLTGFDFVFTDPPYGHNNNNGDLIHNREKALGKKETASSVARPIANDGVEANDLFRQVLPLLFDRLSPGCCCCCCGGGGGPDPQFARWSLWLDEVFNFKQMVVWDKGAIGMGWHYRRSYETILVGEKPGAACRWFDETQTIENIIRPGYRGISKIIPRADQHPTEKPIELAAHFIGLHTRPGETVCDCFMGSGTTGIACLRTGRNFIGIEKDPKHFATAVARIRREADQALLPIVSEQVMEQTEIL
ncbi:MAG: hypothetical protein RIQ93_2489 [Verrucomicrobiota bacterium]|jgi:site-specific DNA-methyltransferase (adenine-specific)